jgi:hypothetical protein
MSCAFAISSNNVRDPIAGRMASSISQNTAATSSRSRLPPAPMHALRESRGIFDMSSMTTTRCCPPSM